MSIPTRYLHDVEFAIIKPLMLQVNKAKKLCALKAYLAELVLLSNTNCWFVVLKRTSLILQNADEMNYLVIILINFGMQDVLKSFFGAEIVGGENMMLKRGVST